VAKKEPKVLLIGLDGGTLDVILPLIKEGRLPVISRLMKNGSYGVLQSTIHPITYPAWSSFMTGKNPGKHGIYDFYKLDKNDYKMKFINASFRNGRTLWKILSDNGKKVGIFNMPVTYPPEKVNGFLISGLGTPASKNNFTYPEDLYGELVDKFGEYLLLDTAPGGRSKEQFLNRLIKITEDTINISKYLLKGNNIDLFAVVFSTTDIVSHFFWHCMDPSHPLFTRGENQKYGDAVSKIYEQIDKGIGELIDCFSEAPIVIIMSDHGFGPIKKVINLNNWLRENGYLKIKNSLHNNFQNILTKMKYRYQLSKKWKSRIDRLIPSLRKNLDSYISLGNIDWKNTKAFNVGVFGNICINVKGQWANGIVKSGTEYEKLREEISGKLKELKDPEDEERIIERVYKREEIYTGAYLIDAPDLIVQTNNYKYHVNSNAFLEKNHSIIQNIYNRQNTIRPNRLSTHRLNGAIIFNGEMIQNIMLENAEIIDVAPTISYLLKLCIPKDMDGKVLKDIFHSDHLRRYPITYTDFEKDNNDKKIRDYTDIEEDKVKEMLQGLGYLD
jgi:predicted AlkP superfamily phosphohydrolase/phosphomutase